MYVDVSSVKTKKKTYTRYLIRESFRENGKVKHRTLANISHCSPGEIEAIRLALRHKANLNLLGNVKDSVSTEQGLSVGALWVVYNVAKKLGIVDALGTKREGKLALWQILARIIDQGSRLSAVRLASSHAACDILDLKPFDEDDLYLNLDWLCDNQTLIEDRLFRKRSKSKKRPQLFLYDVTSSYLEGEQNELAAFGYNRDGKKHKKQIVVGLLCDEEGVPVSIEVFEGNTQDLKTFGNQIEKVAMRFGTKSITFVGDRGMIKSNQIEDLGKKDFHFITAITKSQIESLMKEGIFQMELFDQELAEVEDKGNRYILRRNPVRAEEIEKARKDKYAALQKEVGNQNLYLKEHPRAKLEVAMRKVCEKSKRLKILPWIEITSSGRDIQISIDKQSLEEIKKLDGCYVIKTDLSKKQVSKEVIHNRYKDLALVEKAFRFIKTAELEMRPIYVRLESRTRGHALVVMLSYLIIQELSKSWMNLNMTVQEGLNELSTLCMTIVTLKGSAAFNKIPQPRTHLKKLLQSAEVVLPEALPYKGIAVTTRKKLPEQRKISKN